MRPRLLGLNAGWMSRGLAFLNGSTNAQSNLANGHRPKIARPMLLLLFVTVCLVLCAEILVFGRALGFGLVVFVAITGIAGLIVRRVLIQRSDKPAIALVVLIAGMLPALEYVQASSMMFFSGGIVIFVALINGGMAKFGTRIWHVCKYWLTQVVRDMPEVRQQLASLNSGEFDWKRFGAGLILPVGTGLIFFGSVYETYA